MHFGLYVIYIYVYVRKTNNREKQVNVNRSIFIWLFEKKKQNKRKQRQNWNKMQICWLRGLYKNASEFRESNRFDFGQCYRKYIDYHQFCIKCKVFHFCFVFLVHKLPLKLTNRCRNKKPNEIFAINIILSMDPIKVHSMNIVHCTPDIKSDIRQVWNMYIEFFPKAIGIQTHTHAHIYRIKKSDTFTSHSLADGLFIQREPSAWTKQKCIWSIEFCTHSIRKSKLHYTQ